MAQSLDPGPSPVSTAPPVAPVSSVPHATGTSLATRIKHVFYLLILIYVVSGVDDIVPTGRAVYALLTDNATRF